MKIKSILNSNAWYHRFVFPWVKKQFYKNLVVHTGNFSNVHWLGKEVWQSPLDIWTIQETFAELKPSLLIECGTYRGGSAMFFAQCFELMKHECRILSIDIESLHSQTHPSIDFLIGSTLSDNILQIVQQAVDATKGPVMIILDDNHEGAHVLDELKVYTKWVTPQSYCFVQDGSIDTVDTYFFKKGRPGPYWAIQEFMKRNDHFFVDKIKCDKFLVTHHPSGWLKRVR